jgi:hypothetical protein
MSIFYRIHFLWKFKSVCIPKQELSLGEAMTPLQVCLKFRMYNPGKVTEYGVLVRIMCEAVSGYICNMEIYAAKRQKLGTQYYRF